MSNLCGMIVPCPVEVSETGFIKIVADQRHCRSAISRWQLKAKTYDLPQDKCSGSWFDVTEEEVLKWLSNQR